MSVLPVLPVLPRRPRSRLRRPALLIPIAFALLLVATSCGAPPSSLAVTTVVTNLANPWDIAFAPDGTMLYTERAGRIDSFVGGVHRVMATPADTFVSGEAGMMGIAVDPAFATNRRLYTCFASTLAGPNRDIRVVRWTVDVNYTSLSNRTDILTGMPVNTAGQAGRHAGCRTRFGPDGYLWVTAGDAATGTNPQNPVSLGGKVLRITTDGAGAPGNAGAPFLPQIYSYGHRNPQGVSFRPSDGAPFEVEHGTGCDDEVNKLVPGGNYGWDPVPGYDESQPMTDKAKFPGAVDAIWSSGCPTIAPSGATFLTGTQWGAWNGALAIAVLKGTELRIMKFSAAETQLQEWIRVEDQGRLRVAVEGPDGNLYLAQDANPGAILKVVPTL